MKANVQFPSAIALAISVAFISGSGISQAAPRNTADKNRAIVVDAMTSLFVKHDSSAVERLYAPNYIQHNPQMPQGRDVLVEIVKTAKPELNYEVCRVIAEGDLVAIHGRVTGWGPKPQIAVDIFRLENGKIAEHWDVLQEEVPVGKTVSGRPMCN